MRSSLLVVVLISCGTTSSNTPRMRMSAREIVDASSPAIVRVEAGEDRVGTGFILDGGGLIATNLHVIEGESTIKVKLYKDGGEYQVTSIAAVDRGHDLAIMRISPKGSLPTVRLGDSGTMSAGDKVYAIGNPLGMDYSVSDGLVSQVRTLSPDLTILQISAPISQGSSGGPLFNQFGEVIGVTTMIVTQGQNINLAVPGNYLRPLLQQPQTIGLAEFAKATKDIAEAHGEHAERPPGADSDDDTAPPARDVPKHTIAIWDGCGPHDIADTFVAISSAIEIGAPLYNKQTSCHQKSGGCDQADLKGFEECFRVYEGTALKLEQSGACKGVRNAFGDGLLRASAMKSFKDKAWAMRDTFDGLLSAAGKWCDHDPKACKQISQQMQP